MLKQDPPQDVRGRILTELSGSFDTVALETVVDRFDDSFRQLQEMFANQGMSESMRQAYGLITSGTREFYTIEAEIQDRLPEWTVHVVLSLSCLGERGQGLAPHHRPACHPTTERRGHGLPFFTTQSGDSATRKAIIRRNNQSPG